MNEATKKIAYAALPSDIKKAFESTHVDEAVTAVGDGFKLHVDQTGALYNITNGVLTGQVPPSQFIDMLVGSAKIEQETATEIAKVINEKVFLAVRESLKKIHGVGEEALPREAAPLEKKNYVLQAIEAPENVPMHSRVMEASASSAPSTAPRIPETPEPTRLKAPEPVMPPAPVTAEPITPAPVAETPTEVSAPEPAPAPTPAPKASPVKTFDPYREAAN